MWYAWIIGFCDVILPWFWQWLLTLTQSQSYLYLSRDSAIAGPNDKGWNGDGCEDVALRMWTCMYPDITITILFGYYTNDHASAMIKCWIWYARDMRQRLASCMTEILLFLNHHLYILMIMMIIIIIIIIMIIIIIIIIMIIMIIIITI